MAEWLLRRERTTNAGVTFGTLTDMSKVRGFSVSIHTLEDAIREPLVWRPVSDWKIPAQTAIPRGRYQVVLTMSQRFKRELPLLVAVPGFAGIRIHSGNVIDDTEGCIIVGYTRQAKSVGKSRLALEEIIVRLRQSETWLTITNPLVVNPTTENRSDHGSEPRPELPRSG